MTAHRNVTRWADEIEREAKEQGVDLDIYVPAGLAHTHVESLGNPRAHRIGSQYYSIFQLGRLAGIDAGLPDRGRRTTEVLRDDPDRAIRLWIKLCENYRARIFYGDHRVPPHVGIAIFWKGGAGTARRVRDYLKSHPDASLWDAVNWIERNKNRSWRIPNLGKYIKRIQRVYPSYEHYYKHTYQGIDEGVDLASIGGLLGKLLGAFA